MRLRHLARSGLFALALVVSGAVLPSSTSALYTDVTTIGNNVIATATLAPPSSVTASNNAGTTTLTWTATSSTFATGYLVYRASSSSGPWTQIATVTGPATNTYADTTPPGGTSYYILRTYIQNWTSADSNNSSATYVSAPTAPVIGTATLVGNTGASVTFSAPSNNGGTPITSYTVTSDVGGVTATGTSSPIALSGLADGLTYRFQATATNSAGTGPASAWSNSITPTFSWKNPATPPSAIGCATSGTDTNGNVYVIGGTQTLPGPAGGGASGATTTYAYSASANSWTTRAPLPSGEMCAAGATDKQGRIYVFGGVGYWNGSTVTAADATTYRYDPAADTWTRLADMPAGRWGAAAAIDDLGNIHVIGGSANGGRGGNDYGTGTHYVYNPSTNTWTTAAGFPYSFLLAAAASDKQGRIFVFGGVSSLNDPTNAVSTVTRYDRVTDTWTGVTSNIPKDMAMVAATDPAGRIYVTGGISRASSTAADPGYSFAARYDPSADTWSSSVPNMPTARIYATGAFAGNGALLIVGGSSTANNSGPNTNMDGKTYLFG